MRLICKIRENDRGGISNHDSATPWKIVFKEMIWFNLRHPPFWFSMLESKKGYVHIYWKENIEDHYLRKLHHIF